LFKKNELIFKAIILLYNPTKYKEIKRSFKINSNNSKDILFGYRYCLNTLSLKKVNGIYYPLYDNNYLNFLKDQFYPGNDTAPNYVYSSIMNHFKTKPNEGCYVCLCKKDGYYHCIKSGFPTYKQLNLICPKCSKPIRAKERGILIKEKYSFKREGYYLIFKSEKEIKELKKIKTLKIN
jgi:hypothetical protein